MGRCMHSGCCCCYGGVDLDNQVLVYKSASDFLCIRQSCCLDVNTQARPIGCVTDKAKEEICKCGLYCCECGVIQPKSVCQSVAQFLCCYEVASFPCDRNYVPSCSCAYLFLQCAPVCGCCTEPPTCPALDHLQSEEMDLNIMERY